MMNIKSHISRLTFFITATEKLKLPLIFSKIKVAVNYNQIFGIYIIFEERKNVIEKFALFSCIWFNC